MNSNQIASLIRTGLKMLAAFLIAHGYSAAGNHINILNTAQIVGGVLGAVSTIWSLIVHANSGNGTSQAGPGASILILFASLSIGGAVMGCSSAPSNMYKTEATIDTSVSTAMTSWGNYVAQFHPGTNVELQVRSAFDKFQETELFAIDATDAYAAETATNSAASSVAETTAWQSVSQAATDLSNLILQFENQTNKP